jgi:hypothetical protein
MTKLKAVFSAALTQKIKGKCTFPLTNRSYLTGKVLLAVARGEVAVAEEGQKSLKNLLY